MDSEMKIAVLFDAENIAGKYTEVILNEANNLAMSSSSGFTATGPPVR